MIPTGFQNLSPERCINRLSSERIFIYLNQEVVNYFFIQELVESVSTESLQSIFRRELAEHFSAESWQSDFQLRFIISILQPGIHISEFVDLLRFRIIRVLQATNFYFYQGIFFNPCFGRLLFFSSNTFYEN